MYNLLQFCSLRVKRCKVQVKAESSGNYSALNWAKELGCSSAAFGGNTGECWQQSWSRDFLLDVVI